MVMDNSTAFKLQIVKYTLIITVIFEAGSFPFLGFSLEYLIGLLAGTAVSIFGFLMLYMMSEMVLNTGQKWLSSAGYMIRLMFYGIAFLICAKFGGLVAGVACLIGFMTGIFAIIFVHGIRANFSKDKKDKKVGKEGD